MENYVLKCYESYKKFMCLKGKGMPLIQPKIDEKSGKKLAYVNSDELLRPVVIVYISPYLQKMSREFQESILFHQH